MSNEYKAWELDELEKELLILREYPFLRCRNLDGTIDTTAKFPMMYLEIPEGWYKIFFQMCADIKPILEEFNLMESFYFVQVKEKFNYLRCHCGGGSVPQKIREIIAKYEKMAQYVCTKCGRPAVYETRDYLASFCSDCLKDYVGNKAADKIEFKTYFVITSHTEGTHCDEKKILFKSEWDRYLQTALKENT